MTYVTYYIPANYTDAGKLFGLFPIRNAIEAALVSIPILFFCFRLLPFALTTDIILTMVLVVPAAGFALMGAGDDCLTRFLSSWWQWRRSRRIIAFRGTPMEEKRGREAAIWA